MKLLTKEDLKGIDSTKDTIAKWDEFFRTAIPNLGYKQSVVDEMYPYERGVPKLDGTYLPVSHTGRVFFEMSWADKLMMTLACINSSSTKSSTGNDAHQAIRYVMKYVWKRDPLFANACFGDLTAEEIDLLSEGTERDLNFKELLDRMWQRFIMEADIVHLVTETSDNNERRKINPFTHIYSKEEKELWAAGDDDRIRLLLSTNNTIYMIYFKGLEDVYGDKFPDHIFQDAIGNMSSSCASKFENYKEVYMQQYLVISLNPIDKFMCSTKQAFSSCISIAKQADTRGTNSVHAFGLPALFPSDSIFMVFMTPGKHKNMYWEKQEWEKPAESRNKEKAYKYLKMTCRALTYKGTMLRSVHNAIKILEKDSSVSEEVREAYTALEPKRERLFIGREYSARGEDFIWPMAVELLLARQGISTGMASVPSLSVITKEIWTQMSEGRYGSVTPFQKYNREQLQGINYYLRYGAFVGNKGVEIDRFGFLRGIYYDNIVWTLNKDYQKYRSNVPYSSAGVPSNITDMALQEDEEHQIYVGMRRHGSCGVSISQTQEGLDMFLMMAGKQKYNWFNKNIKICSDCGAILDRNEARGVDVHGQTYCTKCRERLGVKECESCHYLYTESEAHEHELYNIRELTNPNNYQELPPKGICKHILKEISVEAQQSNRNVRYLCAHCGTIKEEYYYNGRSGYLTEITFHGITITVSLCSDCRSKAVMCDRCKKILFIGDIAEACLLLPNRRVICPDCVDNIRAKQEVRTKLKFVLDNLTNDDIAEELEDNVSLRDVIARRIVEAGVILGNSKTLIKDVNRQIDSYMKAHGGELPVLRASNPSEEDRQEEELVIL